ncbi:pH response protein PalF [Aspergillus luchuensis]|uniref:pH response protein PalF n=1 Tax=Aspergillus kawachii TaxID=1069201 RepID=A0A146FMV3_ASPKA|nr:pH response protein PalF [Aspergillus luchuensis]
MTDSDHSKHESWSATLPFPPTTSTVASLLFRASPIDPALRPPSPSNSQSQDSNYKHTSSSTDSQPGSRQSTTDTGAGASSASSQYSGTLPEASSLDKYTHSPSSSSNGSAFPSSLGPSLPGLSALASVASAPTSNLRYVYLARTFPYAMLHRRDQVTE